MSLKKFIPFIILIAFVALGFFVYSQTFAKSSNLTDTQLSQFSRNDKADKDFINFVIPHHQDAIDNSILLKSISKNPEFVKILEKVISDQSKEVEKLKSWHKLWFGRDYKFDGGYTQMMTFSGKAEPEDEKKYLVSMQSHHKDIITYAKKILNIGKAQYRSEILELSQSLINSQEQESTEYQKIIESKYSEIQIESSKVDNNK